MTMEFAIADTCFLIDWSLWRRRDTLFKVFKTVFVPETVLNEIVSENTIVWIADAIAEGKLSLFTETLDIVNEARRIVEKTRVTPGIRGVDLPEAICLVIGLKRKYIVLTENRGALMSVDLLDELKEVVVWRALEVIKEAYRRRLFSEENPLSIFREYELDTHHRFPISDLERVIYELKRKA